MYYYDNKLDFLFFIGIPSICDPLVTNDPHIGYGKHLVFIPSTLRCGILENGSSTQVNHTETSYYDNKLNFLFFIGIPSICDPLVTNNPHKGYGKHLAFIPSTLRCGILENGSSTHVKLLDNHQSLYPLANHQSLHYHR